MWVVLLEGTRNVPDARDLYQEVLIKSYILLRDGKHQCAEEESLMPWLSGFPRNELKHYWRKRKNRARFVVFTIEMEQEAEPPRHGDPYQRQRIGNALKMLGQQSRVIVILHHIKGYSFKKIAAMRNIALNTATSDCSKAVIRLREILKTRY